MNPHALILIGTGLLCLAVGMVLLGGYWYSRQTGLAERLSMDAPPGETSEDAIHRYEAHSWLARFPLLTRVAALGDTMSGTQTDRMKTRRLLAMAGFHDARCVGLLTAGKYGAGVMCVGAFLCFGLERGERLSLSGLAGSLMLMFISGFVIELWLKIRASRRGQRLSDNLPDALDLMVICAEAGLPLARLLGVVSKELAFSAPEVADELGYTYMEMQILSDRRRALLNLAERCGVDNITAMVATLVQAERYGTPLSHALKTISEESRKALVLELEEKTGKLPAQLSVPLMTLILPPVIAMMGAPAMVRIVRLLGS